MKGLLDFFALLGQRVFKTIRGIGRFGLFSVTAFVRLGSVKLRYVVEQIHFIGNYSLLIIGVSGLFVGFVLGLQGYYVLVSYGSEEALGVLVALSLVRELGPVVTALLFCGGAPARRSPPKVGLMRAGEQLTAMEMMGVDPMRHVIAPALGGRPHRDAYPCAGIFSDRHHRRVDCGVGLIGTDSGAFWSQMESSVDVSMTFSTASSKASFSALP